MEITYNEQQIADVASKILNAANSKILSFYGAMGTGKTTLIKAIIRELGATDPGSSPTFGIVNEYHDAAGEAIVYHFDFYRLEDPAEALDIGFEEYLELDAWILIEWPQNIESLLPEESTKIRLDFLDTQKRLLRM